MKQYPKSEVLELIAQEHVGLMLLLDKFTEDELILPEVMESPPPGQSCKDILAHLTAWEQRMIVLVRAEIAGEEPPKYPTAPKFNQQVFEENKDKSLADVWMAFNKSYEESLALVRGLTEAEFNIKEVWQLVGYNTYNHYKWASKIIRRWRRKLDKQNLA